MTPIPWIFALALCSPAALENPAGPEPPIEAELLSLTQAGLPASSDAFLRGAGGRVVSAGGRWVVFESAAADLVPLDENAVGDVYLRDRLLGTTRRISNGPAGAATDGHSGSAVLSADGERVAFVSRGSDLAPAADGAHYQVYVWNREDDSLRCASLGPDGGVGGGNSYFPVLSEDGSRLAFYSEAPDLVPGDTNLRGDIFVLELTGGGPRRANRRPDGTESPPGALPFFDLSGDGCSLAFVSADPDLSGAGSLPAPQVHLLDLATGQLELVSYGTDGALAGELCQGVALGRDGRVVAFECAAPLRPDDTNGVADVYLRDRALGRTRCLSLDGEQLPMGGFGARLSPGGRFAVFSSRLGLGFSPAQLFLHDRAEGRSLWLSEIAGLPADGRLSVRGLARGRLGGRLFLRCRGLRGGRGTRWRHPGARHRVARGERPVPRRRHGLVAVSLRQPLRRRGGLRERCGRGRAPLRRAWPKRPAARL